MNAEVAVVSDATLRQDLHWLLGCYTRVDEAVDAIADYLRSHRPETEYRAPHANQAGLFINEDA